jgi:hypothetical protein
MADAVLFNDLVTALAHLLPRRQLTAEDLAEIIERRDNLREKAKDSHARVPKWPWSNLTK